MDDMIVEQNTLMLPSHSILQLWPEISPVPFYVEPAVEAWCYAIGLELDTWYTDCALPLANVICDSLLHVAVTQIVAI